jgi:hypothetical protein
MQLIRGAGQEKEETLANGRCMRKERGRETEMGGTLAL